MAQIIENLTGRRKIRLSADDVISIVREYQSTVKCAHDYEKIREQLLKREFYLPEEV